MVGDEDKSLLSHEVPYLKKIENMVFGDDPRQGYVEDNTFYHPQLSFSFSFPKGWKLQNQPSQVIIAPEKGNAVLLLQAGKSNISLEDHAYQKVSSIEGTQLLDTENKNINGLESIIQIYDVAQEEGETLRMALILIRKGTHIFSFTALSTSGDFRKHEQEFQNSVFSFQELRDEHFLNRKPQRIKLIKANGKENLQSIFQRQGMKKDLWDRLAILNKSTLAQIPSQNQLIKIIK
jgi:predicted Zn-dependent protease